MFITTYGESVWDEEQGRYVTSVQEGYEYGGTVAQAKGGSQSTTTTAEPSELVAPFLGEAFSNLNSIVTTQGTPAGFQGSGIAEINSNQQAGLDAASGVAGQQNAAAGSASDQLNSTLNGQFLNPASNPNLQATADAAVDTVFRGLTRNALPAIRGGAVASGGVGGSRQGIAEGLAISDANQQAQDATAQIFNNNFQSERNRQIQALGLTGSVQNAQGAGANTLINAGNLEQNQAQAELSDFINRFNSNERADFDFQNEFIQSLLGVPFNQTSVQSGGRSSPISGALGGAAAGSTFGPEGAVVGGVLGALA